MKLFSWKPEDSIGDEEIDRQHRELFEIAQALYSALAAGNAFGVVDDLLNRLITNGIEHFATEERLMERHHFPHLKSHRETHREFAEKLTSFKKELDAGKKSVVTMIMPALQSWIKTHTQGDDRQFAEFLRTMAKAKSHTAAE